MRDRDRILLRRAERAGGIARACGAAEERIARRLSKRGLVELARGFGVFSDHYGITPSGRRALEVPS